MSAWKLTNGRPGLVVVDYIQYEHLPEFRGNAQEEMTRISAIWRNGFKRCGCAGFVMSQLSREGAGQEPKLSDLRSSGSLEQDAYCVYLLYRQGADDDAKPANVALLNLAKGRGMSLKRLRLHWRGCSMSFSSWNSAVHSEVCGKDQLYQAESAETADQALPRGAAGVEAQPELDV